MPARKVLSLSKLDIHLVKTNPPGLAMAVTGEVGSPGWRDFAISHYVYVHPPEDGIYEADLIGVPPSEPVPQVVTSFELTDTWIGFPEEHLKGLRIHSETNDLTCMLE